MDSQYHQQYDTISQSSKITSLLAISQNSQTAIKIKLPNIKEVFSARLINNDFINGQLIISGFGNKHTHKLLLKEKKLVIYSQSGGADFSFSTRFISIKEYEGNKCYVVDLPKAIKYRQRRNSYRKHISLSQNITASINDPDGKTYVGQLRNISSGGMKLQFGQTDPEQFVTRSTMPNCTFSVSDADDIVCDFKIQYLQMNDRKNGFSVGGSFVGLEQNQKRSIEHYIADLERRSRRENHT